ncbi:hypothetical protein ABT097_32945 [Streptomyces sp. NPDC002225]|uniref:hypothetical protein n=1 Tax=Streptomyces sp. NPDC002225 TaxID=3154413 RepID=UPI0033312CF0
MTPSPDIDHDRPVLLPGGEEWRDAVHLVRESLETARAFAPGSRCLLPPVTWEAAADLVGDCATADASGAVCVTVVPGYRLEALRACHGALVRAAAADPAAEYLTDQLAYYLDLAHSTDLPTLTRTTTMVLTVLTLDLSAAGTLITHLAVGSSDVASMRTAYDGVVAAWRRAGLVC